MWIAPDDARATEALLAERHAAVERVAARRAELGAVAAASATEGRDDEHDPDGATVAFEHALAAGLLARAEAYVGELDAALARVADGTYGRCGRCGEPIAPGRLAVEPVAQTCVRCAAVDGRAPGRLPRRLGTRPITG